jgi:hypothetical protein
MMAFLVNRFHLHPLLPVRLVPLVQLQAVDSVKEEGEKLRLLILLMMEV